MSLFDRVVIPVASEKDAEATCDAALERIESAGGRVIALHVIEKGGGVPDKASVEQREERADDIFDIVRKRCSDAGISCETKLAFGTDVAETIFDIADEVDATAIAFTPRGGSRWVKLLTGDVMLSLISDTNRPVVVLPDAEED
ncbi:universal stress protein [Haladaptatus caseinilyticus]|uniref:universal stress protein n=1 Tax=Haladaptatus caseinilyticus TaxID=2993314 RepID=UPI00224B1619|nr:universal stress protein [Haladaptatus caseinilyticus]